MTSMNWDNEVTLLDWIETGDVAVQVPHCCPNWVVTMGMGAMGMPLYSNFGVERSKDGSGFSNVALPNKPADAKGSSSMGAATDAGGWVAAGVAETGSSSSPETVSTMADTPAAIGCGAKVSTKCVVVVAVAPSSSICADVAVCAGGFGGTSQPPISSKSIAGAGAGTGGAAVTADGAVATAGDRWCIGAGGGAGATLPGIIPPNNAAACRSFSNCAAVLTIGAAVVVVVPP